MLCIFRRDIRVSLVNARSRSLKLIAFQISISSLFHLFSCCPTNNSIWFHCIAAQVFFCTVLYIGYLLSHIIRACALEPSYLFNHVRNLSADYSSGLTRIICSCVRFLCQNCSSAHTSRYSLSILFSFWKWKIALKMQ